VKEIHLAIEPLTIARLQQKLPKFASQQSDYAEFFQAIAALITTEMQLYNTVPVKCTVARESKFSFPETLEKQADVFNLLSKKGKFRIWYAADRSFDQILCELCLGGTGIPEPEDEGIRPSSNFERRFKTNVMRKLLASVPLAARRTARTELEVAIHNDQEENAPPEKLTGKMGVEVVFELSAFTFAAEITLQFLEFELAESLDGLNKVELPGVTAKDVLGDCLFGFEAFLKPKEVSLAEIMSLQVGHMIHLDVAVSDLLTLTCEGKPVFQGAMRLLADGIEIELRNEYPTTPHKLQHAA
jgi:flagellar motor switch protein FliM